MRQDLRDERLNWTSPLGLTITMKDRTVIRDGMREYELRDLVDKLEDTATREQGIAAAISGDWSSVISILRRNRLL